MNHREVAARAVAARLGAAGFTAYLAGGCVRDRLLGREPKDFDVATDANTTAVQELFPRTVPVGVQFGVVLVLYEGEPIEVVTFRADAPYADGRHPTGVRSGTPLEDAQRRDFTVNGMFLDPATDTVIDYVGGQADLAARVIRAIGDPLARFAEDRLRLMRAVRFAAHLDFVIAPTTFAAMQDLAPSVTDMAWERIGDEIVRMLTQGPRGTARRAFELLDSSGLLRAVLPEVAAMQGVAQSPDFHPEGDVWEHTLRVLAQLDGHSEALALAALLHDVAKPCTLGHKGSRITFYGHCEQGADMAADVCQRLRRSRETRERVDYLVRHHLRLTSAPEMRLSTLKRFLAEDGIDELLELARLDSLAASGDLTHYEFCMRRRAELAAQAQLRPPPLLRGRDLLALGLRPGPRVGQLLAAVADAQLDGTLRTRDEALAWVRGKL
ncbi:CCA tRNA nucleotidyltransferase [Candidatus Binatia bacterium]|nr:CCA tRNA nucleotidyltransferase [Candidatus Binatia bacterium]